jgi:muramoyltetrapeptide carboxypeptidase LdcA involved in peptidoglycan recycling
MEWLKGTAVWPALETWDGAVLFLETSEEAPPAREVKRWLRAYGAQGILHRVCAVLLGRPGGDELPIEEHASYDEALRSVIRDELDLSLPIVTGMDFGHTAPFFSLPYGALAEIDCDARTFAVLEPACSPRDSAYAP